MKINEILTSSRLPSGVLISFFVASFALGPYVSTGSLTILFLGIASMLVWVNMIGIRGSRNEYLTDIEKLDKFNEMINYQDGDKNNLAHYAARLGRLDVLGFLRENGIKDLPNTAGKTAGELLDDFHRAKAEAMTVPRPGVD